MLTVTAVKTSAVTKGYMRYKPSLKLLPHHYSSHIFSFASALPAVYASIECIELLDELYLNCIVDTTLD